MFRSASTGDLRIGGRLYARTSTSRALEVHGGSRAPTCCGSNRRLAAMVPGPPTLRERPAWWIRAGIRSPSVLLVRGGQHKRRCQLPSLAQAVRLLRDRVPRCQLSISVSAVSLRETAEVGVST